MRNIFVVVIASTFAFTFDLFSLHMFKYTLVTAFCLTKQNKYVTAQDSVFASLCFSAACVFDTWWTLHATSCIIYRDKPCTLLISVASIALQATNHKPSVGRWDWTDWLKNMKIVSGKDFQSWTFLYHLYHFLKSGTKWYKSGTKSFNSKMAPRNLLKLGL